MPRTSVAPRPKNSAEGNLRRAATYRERHREEINDRQRKTDRRIEHGATEEGRVCTRCRSFKPWDQFAQMRGGLHGHRPNCKVCHASAVSEARSSSIGDDSHAWGKRRSEISLLHRHGITQSDYDRMLAEQDGRCAICGSTSTRISRKSYRPLLVDHDHETGDIRGLLCDPCNVGIARFNDDPEVLMAAAAYLNDKRKKERI